MPGTGALAMLKRRAIEPRRSRLGAGWRALQESDSPASGSSLRTRAPSIARSGIRKVNVDRAAPRRAAPRLGSTIAIGLRGFR